MLQGICKGRVEADDEHPGCICDEAYSGDHCEFLKGNEPSLGGPAPGSSATSTYGSSSDDNQNLIVGIAAAFIVVAVLGGFFLMRALMRGCWRTKGTDPKDIGAAVAAEEATSSSFSSSTSGIIDNQGPKLFEDDSEEVEDYANSSVPNTGSFDEKDMSDVQIV